MPFLETLRRATRASGLLLLAAAACQRPLEGLWIGDVFLSGSELDRAVMELRTSFGQFGLDTLRWRLLDEGMGPAALLHQRLQGASRGAEAEARRYAARLLRGEEFAALAREQRGLGPDQTVDDQPQPPTPYGLGARVAAAVAALEPGQWAGPLRTLQGWEIVWLERRFDEVRSRSGVQVARMVFPVGAAEDIGRARQDWATLPLSGSERYLRALPSEFRRGRVLSHPKS